MTINQTLSKHVMYWCEKKIPIHMQNLPSVILLYLEHLPISWLLVVCVTFPLVFQADISAEPTLMWPLPWPCTMTLVLYGVIGKSGLQMWDCIFFSFRRTNVFLGQCITVVTSVGQQPLFYWTKLSDNYGCTMNVTVCILVYWCFIARLWYLYSV